MKIPDFYPKQKEALAHLSILSPKTEILFGGGKGGAKTVLGCRWQIERRLKYKGSKGIIGRESLSELKKSTIPSLFEWLGLYGLVNGRDYDYNAQEYFIEFWNKSVIHFFDLFDYPRDPQFQRFGGIEVMDVFVDEGGEISKKCFSILKTLCRKGLRDWCPHCGYHEPRYDDQQQWICAGCGELTTGLPVKCLITCNPSKNWLYTDFYTPWEKGELHEKRAFVPALAKDNPSNSKAMLDELDGLPEPDRSRLRDGNWNYDDSKDRIFEWDDLDRMFDAPILQGRSYTTGDIAAMGDDETIIGVWQGLSLTHIYVFKHKFPHEIAAAIREINTRHSVPIAQTVVDSDGLGIGVAGLLKCVQFHNAGRAKHPEDYENMRSECYFKLADEVRHNRVTVHSNQHKEKIIQELDAIRRKNMHSEKKLGIIPREEIVKNIGRSPDLASMMMMRMYFELNPNEGKYSYI